MPLKMPYVVTLGIGIGDVAAVTWFVVRASVPSGQRREVQ